MPTDIQALVDLLLYLEQNFGVLPHELRNQSLAFFMLRTVRLSLRAIARHGKHGPDQEQ
jgi:hypothetical protein